MYMERNKGFSLLELLIVVAIILIIATIAIPSFLRTRQLANESSAVANLRTLSNAQATYAGSNGGQYGMLPDLVGDHLVDIRFGGQVSGYAFTVTAAGYAYTVDAVPAATTSGRWGFYMPTDGVVRYSTVITMAPTGAAGTPVVQ